MLGRLARWLRALGYDTSYDESLADRVLVQQANAQHRILLTRDRHLLRELRPERALEIRQDDPLQQLHAVATELQMEPPTELFTRCLLCNAALQELDPVAAQPLLPEGVRGLPGPVRRCPHCGRLYWEGSHVRRMRAAPGSRGSSSAGWGDRVHERSWTPPEAGPSHSALRDRPVASRPMKCRSRAALGICQNDADRRTPRPARG